MKNFQYQESRRQYVYYFKLTEEQGSLFKDKRTDLKICLSYTKGGYNYFNGNKNPRGYKLYFTPVTCSDAYGTGTFESSTLLGEQFESGYYVNVEKADRYNKKRLGVLAEILDSTLDSLADAYLKKDPNCIVLTLEERARKAWEQYNATKPKKKVQKNLCAKMRKVEDPYEVWVGFGPLDGWEWRVLKKYQTPDKECNNPYARWLCAVKSPMTYGSWEYGDTYIKDVVGMYTKQVKGKPDLKTLLAERVQV